MMEQVFLELSLAVIVATSLAIFLRAIKQPTIISYILAGIIVGPAISSIVHESAILEAFAQIGIAFLLFIVGLNLNANTMREVGLTSLATGIGQVLFTTIIGFAVSHWGFGMSAIASLYISIAISFSSTIIIVKLLSDKKDLDTLYGKISVGFLIVQDIIAVFVLMLISAYRTESDMLSLVFLTLLKLGLIIGLLYFVSRYALPRLVNFLAESQELLFLFSVSWSLLLALFTSWAGFSLEIGALMAGITLASTRYSHEISSKVRSLRDFFIVLFFISLGTKLSIGNLQEIIIPSLILSAIILIGNPLIVMSIIGWLGYKKRTGFMAGLTVAQISEFSLILIVLGASLGHLGSEVLSIITLVGLITIAGSTYLIMYNEKLYALLSGYLGIFEKKLAVREEKYRFHDKDAHYDVILFGYNRIGYSLLHTLKRLKRKFLVVDYNPDIIKQLAREGVESIYGDAADSELLDELRIVNSSMVISTIPDLDTNLMIIEKIKNSNSRCISIATAHQVDDAIKLYESGAEYVIMPHFLGGEHASGLLEQFGVDINKFLTEKVKHMNELRARKDAGHEHPSKDMHGR